MSIEQTLERIAVALEKIAEVRENLLIMTSPAADPAVKKPGRPAKAVAPVGAPVVTPPPPEALPDPFAEGAPAAAISFEQLTDLLKKHSKTFGVKTTIALMVKHGADATTYKMSTIPTASYQALFTEATADLEKVPGGKTA
jgi:hypothetical protein